MMLNNAPNISKRAFWDIDFNAIDWEKNKEFVIVKIIERGNFDDLLEIINFYGDDIIKKELCNANRLPERTYFFTLTYFNLRKDDLICSITKL